MYYQFETDDERGGFAVMEECKFCYELDLGLPL